MPYQAERPYAAISFDTPMGEQPEPFAFYAVQLNEAESGFTSISGPHATSAIADAAARGMAMAQGRLGLAPRKHAVLMLAEGGILNIETARAVAR
jgi:hypothetical protein